MDNYKIKVKDEAESKEAQELFFELGYEWRDSKRDITNLDATHIYADDGVLTFGFNDFNFRGSDNEELTLPQLRDLVVLKRNDINDATHTDGDRKGFLSSEGVEYFWNAFDSKWFIPHVMTFEAEQFKPIQTAQAALNDLDELREEYKDYHKDPALISGADALRALADGKEVEYRYGTSWESVTGNQILITAITGDKFEFRLKPQTIKLELEIPAPYKAKIGGRDDTSFVLNVGRHQYCYKTEKEYTKARDALEAVFDSAVRGTNS
ncbi:hypothetical protein ACTJL0_04755 [Acinetobacter baumannii]|uniref:hypothetical protein n=1 Tax=Acinetobacter baumannii TaxID=470 RepID=UPI003F8453D3